MYDRALHARPLSAPQPSLCSLLLAGAFLVSAPAEAVTYVGHPVPTKTSQSEGYALYSGMLHFDAELDGLILEPCGGSAPTYASLSGFFDPVQQEPLLFPPETQGIWCGAALAPDLPLVIQGQSPAGGLFTLIFELGELDLQVTAPLEIDAQGVVGSAELQLGADDWLLGTELDGLPAGSQLTVGPLHPLNGELLDRLVEHSAIVVGP